MLPSPSRSHTRQVLEYMGGGDLLNLLIERDTFPEDFTRFYVAEV
jgi:protein-serine/threonine kinase